MKRMRVILLGIAIVMLVAANSWAVTGQLWINTGAASWASLANQPAGAADAYFSTSDINYNSNVGGYTIGGFLNNPTFYNTSGAFHANDNLNNTYFLFTGSTYLNAGKNSFSIPHDDGLQLFIDGIGMVVDAPQPTGPVYTPFDVYAPAAGYYSFHLSYGECYGAPAVLAWTVNGAPVGAPEPASMILLGLGLVGIAGFRRMK